jgi:tight adherence protein B
MAIALIVFVMVLAIVFGVYVFFVVRPEVESERAVRARLKGGRRVQIVNESIVKARERLSVVEFLDTALNRSAGLVSPLAALVARSGLQITPGAVLLACVFAATVTMAIAAQFRMPVLVVLIAGILASVLPIVYVRFAAKKRMAQFEENFPEAVDLIARALRAGHALPTALQMVGEEIPDPIGGEFRKLFDQQNFGMSLPEALMAFAQRVPLIDARFFVTAVMTQREMGGNLSEVLDRLAAVIRDRFKVKRHVRAVSAHGRITGWVLAFLPPAVASVLFIISPMHMRLLTDDPLGVQMVVTAIALQIIGVFIIRRIVDVEY